MDLKAIDFAQSEIWVLINLYLDMIKCNIIGSYEIYWGTYSWIELRIVYLYGLQNAYSSLNETNELLKHL